MARMTPAEQHDALVKAGAERYIETYLGLMAHMAEGGRTPGITVPSKADLRTLFENTTPAYWQQLSQQNPQEAQSQLSQWQEVQ